MAFTPFQYTCSRDFQHAATLNFAADLSSGLFSSLGDQSFSVFGFGASLRRGLAVSTCGFVSRLRVWDRIFRPITRGLLHRLLCFLVELLRRCHLVFGFGAFLRQGLAVSTCGSVSRLCVWNRIFRPSSFRRPRFLPRWLLAAPFRSICPAILQFRVLFRLRSSSLRGRCSVDRRSSSLLLPPGTDSHLATRRSRARLNLARFFSKPTLLHGRRSGQRRPS